MTNPVVNVSVNQQVAPATSVLQKTGAFISQGGTITTQGTRSLLTQLSDLTPLLTPAKALTSLTLLAGVVTAVTAAPHGFNLNDTVNLTIAGAVPAGYNGTFACSITGASSFTYPLATSPGSETTPGTYVPAEVASLTQRATTFFGQGAGQAVSVLEVGPGTAAEGTNFLSSWIAANPGIFYSYLVPRFWDSDPTFLGFLAGFEATSSKTYFFVTTTLATYKNYTAAMKDVVALIEAPATGVWSANVLTNISWGAGVVTATTTTPHGVLPGQWFTISGVSPGGYNGTFLALPGTTGSTLSYALTTNPGAETVLGTLAQSQFASAGIGPNEFSLAALFRITLNYQPSSTNKVTPLNFAFAFGVTPFPPAGNAALINTLLGANINLIGTGAQGGISATVVRGGTMMDGNPFKYWYSVDWVQINVGQNLTAVLINGANNPLNPVDYNQFGINALQQAAVATMASGIADGLVLNPIKQTALSAADFQTALDVGVFTGTTAVNADPFASYVAENPLDYGTGTYNGISIDYTPLRGFQSITVNVIVTNFAG